MIIVGKTSLTLSELRIMLSTPFKWFISFHKQERFEFEAPKM